MDIYRIVGNIPRGEGLLIQTKEFGIINEDGLKKRILELVNEFMKSNKVDKSDTTYDLWDWESNNSELNCDYEFYTDMIYDIVSGCTSCEISPREIEIGILEALVNEGFVKNGLIKQSHFAKDKYGDRKISNESLQRVVKTDEVLLHHDELVELLIKSGLVVEIDEFTIQLNKELTKTLSSHLD
ncbi:hypothetical protein [Aquitalea pelogenes]|uniref:hypothetical protein n=1 Tax=Aquitalea pelogenes TaxID=1293573 RepID=UPI0035B42C8D